MCPYVEKIFENFLVKIKFFTLGQGGKKSNFQKFSKSADFLYLGVLRYSGFESEGFFLILQFQAKRSRSDIPPSPKSGTCGPVTAQDAFNARWRPLQAVEEPQLRRNYYGKRPEAARTRRNCRDSSSGWNDLSRKCNSRWSRATDSIRNHFDKLLKINAENTFLFGLYVLLFIVNVTSSIWFSQT